MPLLRRRRAPEPAPRTLAWRTPEPTSPRHHEVTLSVTRGGDGVAGARVAVRPFAADGALGDCVARAMTRGDGTVTLHLPTGRYAVSARHGADAGCVAVSLDRSGRASLRLEPAGPRVVLTVEARGADGAAVPEAYVEVRAPEGHLAARGWTDERGAAALLVPPGEVEVRVGGASVRALAQPDALVRVGVEAKPRPKPFPADPSLPPA